MVNGDNFIGIVYVLLIQNNLQVHVKCAFGYIVCYENVFKLHFTEI